MVHPLCGLSLNIGTALFALFDMATYTILVLIVYCVEERKDDHSNFQTNATREELEGHVFGYLVPPFVYTSLIATNAIIGVASFLLQIKMSSVLIKALCDRDASDCRRWFRLRATVFVLNFTMTFILYAIVDSEWSWTFWGFLPYAVYCLLEVIVVNEFKKVVEADCCIDKLGDDVELWDEV